MGGVAYFIFKSDKMMDKKKDTRCTDNRDELWKIRQSRIARMRKLKKR